MPQPDDAPRRPSPPDPTDPLERDIVAEYRARERDQRETSQWQKISSAGLEFAVSVALLGAAGYGFDRWRGTFPWGLVVGVAVGFAIGMYLLVKTANKAFK